ncbi:heparinase II/III family protein [Gottfriedia sp. OAE603]|uniref:heparinase II/III domain-containing protein n=1 Tax=Gottfriedia sp. OAE603 TaxID=2663872 RepID=UPI00178BF770
MKQILCTFLTVAILISSSIQTFAEENKEIYITKRSAVSDNTLEYAEKILSGELFVSPNYPAYKIKTPVNWKEDPYKSTTWRLYYQSLDALSYLTNAYEMTNDPKYLTYGLEMIQSFWKVNHSPEKATDSYTYESHAMANRTNNLMYFYHYYVSSPIATEDIQNYLKVILRKHGVVLNDDQYYNFRSNHGIYEDRSLIELASYFPEFSTSSDWKEHALYRTKQHILKDFTPEGLHKEHSPLYFLLVMNLIEDINKIAGDPELSQLVLKGQNAFSKIVLSDFRLPGLGDSDYASAQITNSYSKLDPEFEYVITKGEKGKQPPLVSNVSDSLAVIRDGWGNDTSSIVFSASNFSVVHKHADDLSFLFSQNGQDIFIDSGKYNYNTREAVQKYLRTTFAHNVVTIDGKSYPISLDNVGKSKISNVVENKDSVIMTGEHTIYSGVTVYRTIIYLKDKKITCIQDEVLSDTQHTANQIFNIGQTISTKTIDSNTIRLNNSITMKQHNPSYLKEYFGQMNPIRGFASTTFNEIFPIKQLDFESSGKNIQYFTSISTTPTTVSQFSLAADQYRMSLSDGSNYIVTKPITTPFVNAVSDKSLKISGFTQGNAMVSIHSGNDTIAKGIANQFGNFNIKINKQLAGKKLTVIVKSKNAFYEEASTETIVLDKTAPTTPRIHPIAQTINLLSGTSEKFVTIFIEIDHEVFTTKTNSKGNFQLKIPSPKKGMSIKVYAKDSSGNMSDTRTVKLR